MRRIEKSKNVPQTLQTASVPLRADQVIKEIYAADDVRNQLLADQNYKCAYCECSLTKSYNDVEHYRPKNHYYWLGHNWENLLYSCDLCNRTFKRIAFPLKDESKRVVNPGDISEEEPLIINPALEEPSSHIRFRRFEAVPLTEEGLITIEIFHLNDRVNRPELVNERQNVYRLYQIEKKKIKEALAILSLPQITPEIADRIISLIKLSEQSIEILKSPSHPYSGMLIGQLSE